MPEEITTPVYRHDGFICYSRKTKEFATRLEKAIENYKPPGNLKLPQRHLDIFRDENDFVAGEYHENRDKHLEESAKLIVICSPAARKSKYVNDEIRQFARTKNIKDIIPILYEGIPNNEALDGDEEKKAFPEALCEVMKMPLAINYLGFDVKKDKPNKGIFTDAWFMLLANIYDFSRAEIEQREKRRRIRNRRIIYSILGGSIIVLSVLLIFIWISRNEAIDRKLAAEATQFDALASQMFSEARRTDAQSQLEQERLMTLKEDLEIAEHENYDMKDSLALRMSSLNAEIEQTEQELKMLDTRGREYRKKGKQLLIEADQKWSALPSKRKNWVSERRRPQTPALFSLEVLNASHGECIILHYGDIDQPKFILIGGGQKEVYKKILNPRLIDLKRTFSPAKALPIEMIIASHSDIQSIGGLLAMTEDMLNEQKTNRPSAYNIKTIWYNSFQPLPDKWGKTRLTLNAKALNIKQNSPFDHFVMRPDSVAVSINKEPLKITVIHPDQNRLEEFEEYWIDNARRYMNNDTISQIKNPKEKFSNKALQFNKAPAFPIDNAALQGYNDQKITIPNLASICIVFELGNKRILYAGDALGRDILKGLYTAGFLSEKGDLHFDLMIIPHFGSDLNITKDFFHRLKADHYILLGDGSHSNPEVATLQMLEEARTEDTITMYFANRDGRDNHGNKLDKYFLESPQSKKHRRVFRRFNDQYLLINLQDPVRY